MDLDIPNSANFVTCNHCSSNLAVKRNESVTFTEQIEKLGEQHTEMLSRLDRIEGQNCVAQIDRDWESRKKNYLTVDKRGNQREPTTGIAVVLICALFLIMASGMGPALSFIGLVFTAMAVANVVYSSQKLNEYEAAKKSYHNRRKRALKE